MIDVELGPSRLLSAIGVFAPMHVHTCTARYATEGDLFCLEAHQAHNVYCLNPQFGLHVVQLIAQRLMAGRQRVARGRAWAGRADRAIEPEHGSRSWA